MAIDLGKLTSTTNSAKTANAAASKTPAGAGFDFSHTLAASKASRHARTDSAPAAEAKHAAAKPSTAAVGHGHPAADDQRTPADAPQVETDTGHRQPANASHLDKRRLSSVSLIARQENTARTTTKSAAVCRVSDRAPVVEPGAHRVAAENDAWPDSGIKTAGHDTSGNPLKTRVDDQALKTDGATTDTARHDARDARAATPVAALIQTPLIADQAKPSATPPKAALDDATHGHSSATAKALQGPWQQLFARLHGDAGSGAHGQTSLHANSDSDPAQLLAMLTKSGKAGAHAAGRNDSPPRFGLLPADNSRADGPDPRSLAGLNGSTTHSLFVAQSGPSSAAPASHTSTSALLSAPLASDDWNQAFSRQTLRLIGSGQQQAQIHLHPRELGAISISMTVNDQNQTQIHFAAAHGHVRDAVEAALPQLRQALAAGGLSLGQASVGDQNSQAAFTNDGSQPGRRGSAPAGDVESVADTAPDTTAVIPVSRGPGQTGGIDIFA